MCLGFGLYAINTGNKIPSWALTGHKTLDVRSPKTPGINGQPGLIGDTTWGRSYRCTSHLIIPETSTSYQSCPLGTGGRVRFLMR